jgi:hypothetical protein
MKTILGYLCVDVSVDYIYNNILRTNKATPGSNIFIVDNNGNLIIAEDTEMIGKNSGIDIIDQITKKAVGGYDRVRYNSKSYILVYTATSNQGWKMVELIPTSELYSSIYSFTMFSIYNRFNNNTSCYIFLHLYHKMISTPIVTLASSMKKV